MGGVRVLTTTEAPADVLAQVRALLDDVFQGEFSDADWDHCLGGWHLVVVDGGGHPIAHASVVPRTIDVGVRELRAGYVEAVATAPGARRTGQGSRVMAAAAEVVDRHFEVGVLSTAAHGFYERLGWERWAGPSFVIDGGQRVRTEDEDDGIMVLRVGASPALSLTDPIACRARPGDDW